MSAHDRPDWATVPNLITLVRLALLFPVSWLIVDDGPDTVSVLLLLLWASTDWIDGFLARTLDQVSRTGEILDPIADRLGVVGIVISLALVDLLPWAALVIILAVDVAMTALATSAALDGRIRVSRLGKVRTFVVMGAIFLLLAAAAWVPSFVGIAQALLWAGVALHIVCGADYIIRARRAPAARAQAGPPSQR